MSKRVLYVASGIPQDVCHRVLSLEDAEELQRLVTCFCYHPDSLVGWIVRSAGKWGGPGWSRKLGRREFNYCRVPHLHATWCPELQLIWRRKWREDGDAPAAFEAFGEAIDRAGCRAITPQTMLVVAREDACLRTFRRAAEQGAKCLYDLPAPFFPTVSRLVQQEAEKFPDASDEASPLIICHARLDRKRQEVAAADRVLVASEFTRDSLVEAGCQPASLSILPYGCDPPFPETVTRSAKPLFLAVGYLSLRKGTPRLLEAWKKLGAHRTCTLRLIGSSLLRPRFLQQYAGIFEHFPAMPRGELSAHYSAAHALVFPAIADGYGLVVNEALSHGLPVLASRNCGAPSIVTSGASGLLYDHGNDEQLLQSLDWMLSHPRELAEMGRAARETARRWTWEQYRVQFRQMLVDSLLLPPTASTPSCAS